MAGRHIVNEEGRSRRVRPLPPEPPPGNRGDVSFNNELHQDVDGYTPCGASHTAHSFPEDGQPSQSLSGISFQFDQSSTHEYDLPQTDSGPASQFDQSSTHEYDLPPSDSGPAFQSDQSSIYYNNPPQTEYVTAYEKPLPDYESVRNNGRAENSEGESLYQNVYCDMNQARRDVRNEYCSNDYQKVISNEIMEKRDRFKSRPEEFIKAFESTQDEIRTDEENFIIVDLLRKGNSNSPILGGNLDQLAMLACCSSPHVVKRALDALLNEIFLSISDSSKIPRFRNILEAEEILRASFLEFIYVDHMRAKCHRMTTYAWLITLVLLKCTKNQFIDIQPKIKEFDKTLDGLQNDREHIGRNTFRYGIYLARESIKRIVQSCGKKISSESLKRNIRKCENFLTSKLEKDEVKKLGQAISDGGSWLDLHVCLVFLQDLPKFHQFQDNRKPIFLIQMLIADYRERCGTNKVKSLLKIPNYKWQFEILVYHLTLRLIRTSKNKANIEQVLTGEQGCGGVFRNWIQNRWETTKDDQLVLMHLKLCQRAVFLAKPNSIKKFIEDNSKGDEKRLVETLSILRLSSTYKDKVLEISPESRLSIGQQRVNTFDALMSGKKCLLKLHQHSKEEVLRAEALKTVPLRQEIEILQVLSAERCENLVRLLGSSIEAPMHMIIERTPKGDLLTYLQDLSNPPEAEELLQIALDICKAMIYLGQQEIIHRDLCAKNCFVSFMHERNLLVTKLGDFHLAVHSYTGPRSPASLNLRRNNSVKSLVNEDFPKQFAVRWMAVETLRFGEFSPASDVWSFGVLLFEIFTLGRKPYANMPSGLSLDRDEDVRQFVLNGNRLEHHPKIPESIGELIQFTMIDVAHRPTFSSIKDKLMGIKFDDEIYADPAFFDLSNANIYDTSRRQINLTRTGCSASDSFCECQNASDIAAPLNDDDGHFIKEFVPASSYPDILKLIELEFPSVAVITDRIVHIEKVELITEVGDFGSLEEFINLLGCPIESAIRYLSQIGEAVSFLHNRGFIHRNLRAASVFMYSNGNAKLACFARVAKLKTETMSINFPMFDDSLRRSSPEVIIDGKYSKASDVWAFAVLIWEMFTLIDKEDLNESDDEIPHLPYHHLRSKEQILSYLKEGKRLGRPKNSPDWLYKKMLKCWEYNAQDRLKCQDIMNCTNEHIYSTTTRL